MQWSLTEKVCLSILRRLASSLLLATTVTAAALVPGAAVFASTPARTSDCLEWSPPTSETFERFPLIVVGRVERVDEADAEVDPEQILKGSVQGTTLRLPHPGLVGLCGNAVLEPGDQVLLLLRVEGGLPEWPTVDQAYYLRDGMWANGNPTAYRLYREQELIDMVTSATNQVVVPAQTEDEGEGIEWGTTVLPIAVALGVVFVIGLFLMRIWHRIDPS